ncbi:hypothetical protein BC834DRAFT_58395 [Gloeopeniophorella convolvens]|nr:hypothetical protein BC834DRAFT_58395 [Gloeopeniophorella convolvens]
MHVSRRAASGGRCRCLQSRPLPAHTLHWTLVTPTISRFCGDCRVCAIDLIGVCVRVALPRMVLVGSNFLLRSYIKYSLSTTHKLHAIPELHWRGSAISVARGRALESLAWPRSSRRGSGVYCGAAVAAWAREVGLAHEISPRRFGVTLDAAGAVV